jgi:hypothetical protein
MSQQDYDLATMQEMLGWPRSPDPDDSDDVRNYPSPFELKASNAIADAGGARWDAYPAIPALSHFATLKNSMMRATFPGGYWISPQRALDICVAAVKQETCIKREIVHGTELKYCPMCLSEVVLTDNLNVCWYCHLNLEPVVAAKRHALNAHLRAIRGAARKMCRRRRMCPICLCDTQLDLILFDLPLQSQLDLILFDKPEVCGICKANWEPWFREKRVVTKQHALKTHLRAIRGLAREMKKRQKLCRNCGYWAAHKSKCGGCRQGTRARYCSVKCQRADWVNGGHKMQCPRTDQDAKARRALEATCQDNGIALDCQIGLELQAALESMINSKSIPTL